MFGSRIGVSFIYLTVKIMENSWKLPSDEPPSKKGLCSCVVLFPQIISQHRLNLNSMVTSKAAPHHQLSDTFDHESEGTESHQRSTGQRLRRERERIARQNKGKTVVIPNNDERSSGFLQSTSMRPLRINDTTSSIPIQHETSPTTASVNEKRSIGQQLRRNRERLSSGDKRKGPSIPNDVFPVTTQHSPTTTLHNAYEDFPTRYVDDKYNYC